MLLLAGTFALTSCDKDVDSNPVLIQGGQPVSFVLNTPEFAQEPVALSGTENVALTWSQPVLTPENAPLGQESSMGISYAVQVSKDGNFTKTFEAALADVTDEEGNYTDTPSDYNYVQLATTYASCRADVTAEELNTALNQLYIWGQGDELTAVDAFVRVLAIMTLGDNSMKTLAVSNTQKLSLIASEWIDVLAAPVKEAYLWVPGNGNGWNHGVAPVLVSQDGVVFSGYAYMNGQFKFTDDADWSHGQLNNGSFSSWSDNISMEENSDGNITFVGAAGMYYFTVDLDSKSVNATPVTWSVIGGFNDWGGDEVMTYDESAHCLSVAVNFSEETQWKFRRDGSWDVNLGAKGDVEPSTDMDGIVANGKNFVGPAGEHTIQLFIERPAQDGLHAVIK